MKHGREARAETATANIIKCIEIQIILFNVIAQRPNPYITEPLHEH